MKKYLLFFIILVSCTSNQKIINKNSFDFDFNKDLTIEEFKLKLNKYANSNSYPNIDD